MEHLVLLLADKEESQISTVVVRGSTDNIMDDIERAVDSGVNTFKALTKDGRFLPGAGATEIEVAKQLTTFGEVCYLSKRGNFFWEKIGTDLRAMETDIIL